MIFNSLGSNYNFSFVIRSLFAPSFKNTSAKLLKLLDSKFNGKSILLYKGREAIKLALELSGISKGSKVGVNGFTCYVVYQAISEAGFIPTYLDIDRSLNFNVKNLEKYSDIKALIVQNTLGNPIDIIPIKSFCTENKILLIEDLAHSVGSVYSDGSEAGCVGDFTALSFSQDKIVDGISGGALVIRNNKYKRNLKKIEFNHLTLTNQIRDRLYPLLTFIIRTLYPFKVGKIIHYILKKYGILSMPIGSDLEIKYHKLPSWYCSLILFRFSNLENEIEHRRKIVKIYLDDLVGEITSPIINNICELSSNLRFPIFVKNRMEFINYLTGYGIYLSDIWYDAPIAPGKLLAETNYSGECPKSEEISKQILNLPTHINVSTKNATKILDIINKWQSTNQR